MFQWLIRILSRREDEEIRRKNARSISVISFILGFTDSFYAYILSIYFSRVLGSDNVGGFYLVTYAIVFGMFWLLHRIMGRVGGSVRTFLLAVLAAVVFSATMAVLPTGWAGGVVAVALLIAVNIAWVTLDVILEQVSDDGVTGRLRGLYLTVMNAGVLLAPFFATRVVAAYDFGGVFFGVTIGFSVVLAAGIILLRNCADCGSSRMEVRSAWKKMLREPDLFHIYNVSFGLGFFYLIMMIYTPLHLLSLGFSWDDIGILFTVMLLPFIFLQYPLGVLADKRFGEKEFLAVSVAIALMTVLSFGLFSSDRLLFWGVLLFLSRIGAAGIEVLRDSYFYKHVDGGDDDLIAFFRTAYPAANVIGGIVVVPLLFFFPLQSVFIVAAVVLFSSLYSAFSLKDTR